MEGNFENTKYESYEMAALMDAYDAITSAEMWPMMREDPGPGGYMYSRHAFMDAITNKMKLMEDHSGASFGWTMRVMQLIAREGWAKFYEKAVKVSDPE